MLFDYFGDMDSSPGGVHDSLFVLKYNGMRYEKPIQFVTNLSQDLEYLIDFEWRRHSKPIKFLKKSNVSSQASKAKMFLNTPDGEELTEDDRETCESPNTAVDSEITECIVK